MEIFTPYPADIITSRQTGQFASNTALTASGSYLFNLLTGVSGNAGQGNATAISGVLQLQINQIVSGGPYVTSGYTDVFLVHKTGDESISGFKTFRSPVSVKTVGGDGVVINIDGISGSFASMTGAGHEIDIFDAELKIVGGTVSLDWDLRLLSGNWETNTIPQNGRSVVNYGVLQSVSGALVSQISAASAGVASLNGLSGVLNIRGTGNVFVTNNGQNIIVSGSGTAINSDIIYRTGDQTIVGTKIISGNALLGFSQGSYIADGDLGVSILPNERTLYALDGTQSVNWNDRLLYDLSNNPVISWASRELTGVWSAEEGFLIGGNRALTGLIQGANVTLTNNNNGTFTIASAGGVGGSGITGILGNGNIFAINNNNGSFTISGSGLATSGDLTTLGTRIANTGSNLYVLITGLSGASNAKISNVVYTTGTQYISGLKLFTGEGALAFGPDAFFFDLDTNVVAIPAARFLYAQDGASVLWGERLLQGSTGIAAIDWEHFLLQNAWTANSGFNIDGNVVLTGILPGTNVTVQNNGDGTFTVNSSASGPSTGGVTGINVTGISLTGTVTFTGSRNIIVTSNGNTVLISGSGILTTADVSSLSNVLYTTGSQIIQGSKYFTGANNLGFDVSSTILDATQNITIIPNTRALFTQGVRALSWASRTLSDTSEIDSLTWGTRGLFGNWTGDRQYSGQNSLVLISTLSGASGVHTANVANTGSYLYNTLTGFSGMSQNFTYSVTAGSNDYFVAFPRNFPTIPRILVQEVLSDSTYIYSHAVKNKTVSGFNIIFSEVISETGISLDVLATI